MSYNYRFSCGVMPTLNNHTIKSLKPDKDGYYEVVLGALGMPTRLNVWYDEDSVVNAMSNPKGRFNICLRDGNLMGTWGHPILTKGEEVTKLLEIDEKSISHVFGKIWIGDVKKIDGYNARPIMALVKPFGPYGEVLRKSLEDPLINTAFSIRSLCMPFQGPDPKFEYRQVQLITTFDAVHAPGFEMATKRYTYQAECLSKLNEISITKENLEDSIYAHTGTESSLMITKENIKDLYEKDSYFLNGEMIAKSKVGNNSILAPNNRVLCAARLVYDTINK